MTELGIAGKVLAIHAALDAADLDHAFGGALALAFCTIDPRTTQDIDVNVFVAPDQVGQVIAALPADIDITDPDLVRIERDAQTRLWWGETPVDLFLSNHPFHDHAAANRRVVPFDGVELPVLACSDLAVFKTFFARPKDAVDIEAMVLSGAVDLPDLRRTVEALLGADERADFFARIESDLTNQSDDPPIFGR